nr:PepSY-associated TM helix domain-containing protein [Marivibrio halodurans]
MAWLHTWGGLVFGWLLFAVFVTGTLSVFDREIDGWMRPELAGAKLDGNIDATVDAAVDAAEAALRDLAPEAGRWLIELPTDRLPAMRLLWIDGGVQERYLDPATHRVLTPRATHGGSHFAQFHARLHGGEIGIWVVSLLALGMLVAIVTGIVIHKRIFRDFFTFRPDARRQRSWLEGHNMTAVLVLPFHLMIAYSGLVIELPRIMPAGIDVLYDGDIRAYWRESEPAIDRAPTGEQARMLPLSNILARGREEWGPGAVAMMNVWFPDDGGAAIDLMHDHGNWLTRLYNPLSYNGITGALRYGAPDLGPVRNLTAAVEGLHHVEFGGPVVRWLYFLCGAAGSVMIATGLVLFTVKRRKRLADQSPGAQRFHAVTERLNVGAVAGILVACAAYFWANRLLPVHLEGRALMEVLVFLGIVPVALLHGLLRPPRRGWVEQMGLAGLLCLLLPLLNALTSEAHLGNSLPAGTWRLAGVDLTAAACGLVFLAIAHRIARRTTTPGASC